LLTKILGKRPRGSWMILPSLTALSAVVACSAPGKGALIMAISTDMQAPKDISTISIFVTEGSTVKFDYVGRVTPFGTVGLPSTLALVEPDDPSTQIQIRVIGYNVNQARVLRDIQTTVPHQRTALLRVPLNSIDIGSGSGQLPDQSLPVSMAATATAANVNVDDAGATDQGGAYTYTGIGMAAEGLSTFDPDMINSKCDPNQQCLLAGETCMTTVNGVCASAVVDSTQLPAYDDSIVFGTNGSPLNLGACFNVQSCFGGAAQVARVTQIDFGQGTSGAPTQCTFALPELGASTSSGGDAGSDAPSDAAVAEDGGEGAIIDASSTSGGASGGGSSSGGGAGEDSGATAGTACGSMTCVDGEYCCTLTAAEAQAVGLSSQSTCTTSASTCSALMQQASSKTGASDGGTALADAAVQSAVIALAAGEDAGVPNPIAVADAGAGAGSTGSLGNVNVATLNFAMVTTGAQAVGACNTQGQCFVPIENDADGGAGWSLSGSTVTLAPGFCAQIMAGTAQLFATDNSACTSMTNSVPVCEPQPGDFGDGGIGSEEDASGLLPDAGISAGDGGTMGFTADGGARAASDGGVGEFFDAGIPTTDATAGGGFTFDAGAGFPDAGVAEAGAAILTGVSAIVAGPYTTCAILETGSVDCWGFVFDGFPSSPQPMPGLANVTSGAVGGDTSQGFACALESGGAAYCEGNNTTGQLGDGDTQQTTTPFPVTGLNAASSIRAGDAFACALTAGEVECWGDDTYGQVGADNSDQTTFTTPQLVGGIEGAVAIATGSNFACAIVGGTQVECWGSNAYGVLGDLDGQSSSYQPVAVTGFGTEAQLTAIAAGTNHVCVTTSTSDVYCWGANDSGQLGTGAGPVGQEAMSSTPVLSLQGEILSALAAGGSNTCVLTQGKQVLCWGSNEYEQLGPSGPAGASSTFIGVGGVNNVSQIVVGQDHVCALISGGTVTCWGDNEQGQAGTGQPSIDVSPSTVVAPGTSPSEEDGGSMTGTIDAGAPAD
jgi:alpha-tubulin suppressor-like RCC1 family protein